MVGIAMARFLIILALCATAFPLPTPDDNLNITVSVPAGTLQHGQANLFCTPMKWSDTLTFFIANYFAHAATVRAYLGEHVYDFVFAVFFAIHFPFSGVYRGVEAID